MSGTLGNIGLVLLFIAIGGLFAGTEIALVSLRDSQIRTMSQRGRRGARIARLADDPSRFLAAVQIGVTVAGFFSAAFGAATLAGDLTPVLERWGIDPGAAATTALVATTLVIAYLSLVLSELVAREIQNGPGLDSPGGMLAQKAPVVVVRHETDFHAFVFVCDRQTARAGHVGHITAHPDIEPAVERNCRLRGSRLGDTNQVDAKLERVCLELQGQVFHTRSIADRLSKALQNSHKVA